MVEDLRNFPTFSEFFKRKLRSDVRQVSEDCEIVSPLKFKT